MPPVQATVKAFKLYKKLPMIDRTSYSKPFLRKDLKKAPFKGPLFLNETSTVSLLHKTDLEPTRTISPKILSRNITNDQVSGHSINHNDSMSIYKSR